MAMLQEQLLKMLEPAVMALGFDLWGLQLITGGKRHVLRVFIEGSNGVQVDDCAKVSRQIGAILDVEDPIKADYVLEVSSPGLDRFLFKVEHYKQYLNSKITLRLKQPYMGRKNFKGVLVDVENDEVIVSIDQEEFILPFESIERAQILT